MLDRDQLSAAEKYNDNYISCLGGHSVCDNNIIKKMKISCLFVYILFIILLLIINCHGECGNNVCEKDKGKWN